jgi:hypothetical protein
VPGLRAIVDGGGGAVEGRGVLLGPLPGAGLPAAAGVAERRYGNAIAERLLGISNTPGFAEQLGVKPVRFERPRLTPCPGVSRTRHGGQ